MSIASYLSQLDKLRQQLADNLVNKGVSASRSESLTVLVPKVLNVKQDGAGSDTVKVVSGIHLDSTIVKPSLRRESTYLLTAPNITSMTGGLTHLNTSRTILTVSGQLKKEDK